MVTISSSNCLNKVCIFVTSTKFLIRFELFIRNTMWYLLQGVIYAWPPKYFPVINTNIKKACGNDLSTKGGRGWKDKRRPTLGVGDSSHLYFEHWVTSGCLPDTLAAGPGSMDNPPTGTSLKWANGSHHQGVKGFCGFFNVNIMIIFPEAFA